MKSLCGLLLLLASTDQLTAQAVARDEEKPRLIVLPDISSLTPGVAEPDDGQSLIRLMLCTNEFGIERLIATSNMGHGQRTRPDLIRQVVEAYEKVRPNLLLHPTGRSNVWHATGLLGLLGVPPPFLGIMDW
jgi:hypothetical protein